MYRRMMTEPEFFAKIGGVNRYALLDRMVSDCKYWLGFGARHDKYLWANNPVYQIAYMRYLWHSFPDDKKPEWLSLDDIKDLERRMMSIETKGEPWMIFLLRGEEIASYTCRGTFSGERESTKALLAFEHGVDPGEIETVIQYKRGVKRA